ncbi:MAG: urease accessory protein UreF [Nitrospiraceae bacterium]
MHTLALLHGLRYVDSFFPAGGFAYSSGLEAAVQGGAVKDSQEFALYVEDCFQSGLATREAGAVASAHRAFATGHLPSAHEADAELDAMMTGRESRQASKQMGRQVLRGAVTEEGSSSALRQYLQDVEADRAPGHLAVSFGLVLGSVGWTKEQAVAAFLDQQAVGFVSASLKLLPIGQREGQRLLASWSPMIGRLSRRAGVAETMTAWTPVQNIYAMRHSRLASRLFRS